MAEPRANDVDDGVFQALGDLASAWHVAAAERGMTTPPSVLRLPPGAEDRPESSIYFSRAANP